MRHVKIILLTLGVLLYLVGAGNCAGLSDLTNWGGPYLLSLIQEKVNGKVTAREISGNPITGIIFKDLELTGPDGKTYLAADRLEVRLSLSSITAFHLDLGTLALVKPRIFLAREKSGQWNLGNLAKEAAKPAQPPGLVDKIIAYFLREIDLSNLVVQQGEVLITDGGVTRCYTDLDLKSSLTLFNWGQPQQRASLNLRSLGLTTPQGRAELETRLAYGDGRAKIESLNLKLAGQTVVSLTGEVCRPLAGLTCSMTGKIGPLAGDKIHGFWSRWPALWDLSGAISLSSTPEGGKIEVRGKIGQADYAVVGNLNAKVKPAVFDLDLDLKGLSTAQLKEIKDLEAQQIQGLSPVNAHLHLEGKGLPWNPESLAAHLKLEPFQYRDLKVDKVELDLSGNARRQALQASVAGNFGAVDLKASGHLLPLGDTEKGLSGDLAVQTANFQPAKVGLTKLGNSSLNSCFTGKFRVPPSLSLSQAHLAGDLAATGRLADRPLQGLSAGFTLEGRKLTISRANLQTAGLTASLSGTLTESGVDVTFDAAVSGSRALPLPPGSAFASLTAQGAVRGPWKSPQVNLAAQVQKLSLNNVTLESANLNGALAGWPPQSGSLKLVGSQLGTPAGSFTRLNLTANGTGGQWQFQAVATSPKEPKFEVAGTADLVARPLVFRIARLSWHGQGLMVKNQTPFQILLLPGWEITPATFQIDGGTVTIAGLARDQELSGRLEVRDLNAGLLAPLGLAASGKLNGRLILAGTPRNPIIDGQMALTAGKVKDFPIRALSTTLAYRDDQARISGNLEGPQQSRLVWKGSVPVRLSLLPFKFTLAQDGLDLKVQSERLNLSLLTAVTKEVQTADGALDMSVEARGNPRQPRVSGYVRWSPGSLQLRQAGTPYLLVPGEIRLQGDKILIPGLILQSDGTLRLSGEIVLTGLPRVQTRVEAENFRLLNRGGNELWTNGAIDLRGPFAALVAKGHLMVPKAQFRPTFFRSGKDPDVILLPLKPTPKGGAAAPDLYRTMTINVSIEAPGNVILKDPMGQMELTAHLKALKKPDQKLALGGDIRALHGTLNIEEKPFKVERGTLTLPGVPGKPILVDLKANYEMDDITLILAVSNTLANPKISLESLPPLPPADVLSYLVFGAPVATLTKDQYLALGAQHLGVLGGISTGKISEILGSTIPFLGGIRVKSGMMSGRPAVGVEKEVTKNVSIFAGRNLNEERGTYEQQVGVQYKFNKHLSIESQYGTRNSGADVYFNYDF